MSFDGSYGFCVALWTLQYDGQRVGELLFAPSGAAPSLNQGNTTAAVVDIISKRTGTQTETTAINMRNSSAANDTNIELGRGNTQIHANFIFADQSLDMHSVFLLAIAPEPYLDHARPFSVENQDSIHNVRNSISPRRISPPFFTSVDAGSLIVAIAQFMVQQERFAEVEVAIDILLTPVGRASLTKVRTIAPEVEGIGSNAEVFEAAGGMVPSAVSISPAQMAAVSEAPAVEAS